MKFHFFNYRKCINILLTGVLLINLLGCSNNEKNYIETSDKPIYEEETSSKQEMTTIIEEESNSKQEMTTIIEEESNSKQEMTTIIEEETSLKQDAVDIQPNDTEINDEDYTTLDLVVIKNFEGIEKEVDTLLQDENDTVKDKAKGVFISLVDFIFYNGEINGVTFDELTEEGKQKVLKIVFSIDQKIDNYFPDYKETISENTKNAFNKASELIKNGANDIKEFSKEKLGEDNYNSLIEAKDELVYYTKNAVNIIGNIASNFWQNSDIKDLLNTGTSKVKDWYEQFKNK